LCAPHIWRKNDYWLHTYVSFARRVLNAALCHDPADFFQYLFRSCTRVKLIYSSNVEVNSSRGRGDVIRRHPIHVLSTCRDGSHQTAGPSE